MTAQILVVDEDATERKHVKAALEQVGYNVVVKASSCEALAALKQNDLNFDAVIFDLGVATPDALRFIKTVGEIGLDVPVIVQTVQGGLTHVVEALRVGAYDFVIKPVTRARLNAVVDNALTVMRVGKNRPQRKSRSKTVSISAIISASQAMTRVITLARKSTHSTIPIILEGESGVGKEMIARAIHSAGDRNAKPFVVVRCGMMPSEELDTLLFGSTKPQLADASYSSRSMLQEAEGGTLFLEEVGELPLSLQAKLLRIVQDGQTDARAGQSTKRINVRIISSTTKDLIAAVRSGKFREDLYYRLNVYPVVIPALRRRKEDVSQLVRLFVEQASHDLRKARPLTISPSTLALLTSYDWPGNVRQLENAIYRAVTLAETNELSNADFPQIVTLASGHLPVLDIRSLPHLVASEPQYGAPIVMRGDEVNLERQIDQVKTAQGEVANGATVKGAIASIDEFGDVRTLAEIEEELIRFALGFYRGQMSQVARKLGIGRSTLYRKLKDYWIDPDDPLRDVA